MLREAFIIKLGISREILNSIRECSVSEEEYLRFQSELRKSPETFCEEIRKRPQFRKLFLWLFLYFAQDAEAEYKKRGIDEEVYIATMKDILLWAEECRQVHGEYGIEEAGWLCHHVTLNLFRLGRLQFQYRERPGELELHIPKDSNLLFEDCCLSLKMAVTFFGKEFGNAEKQVGELRIFSHSWLLNPGLSSLLAPGSNILKFQTLFRIIEIDEASRQAEERVFGMVLEDFAGYPEETSLQKTLKAWLLAGNSCPSALGEINWSMLQ